MKEEDANLLEAASLLVRAELLIDMALNKKEGWQETDPNPDTRLILAVLEAVRRLKDAVNKHAWKTGMGNKV